MSTSSSLAPARKTAEEIIGKRALERAATSTVVQKSTTSVESTINAAMANNPFHKIMLNPALDPEEKKRQVVALLVCTETKEENKARIKAFEEFQEYLQDAKKKMALGVIALTDTDAFSELQKAYQQMNGSLLDFDEKMKPLTDIIEAIYELRTDADGDKVLDVFKEIQDDKNREAEHKRRTTDLSRRIDDISFRMNSHTDQIAKLSEQKSFFGLGGIKQEAREAIAILEQKKVADLALLNKAKEEVIALKAEKKQIDETGDYARRKAKLRELLDLNSDTHIKRQKDLVAAAVTFVNNASERVGNIRSHLGMVDTQVEKLLDNNGRMSGIYAITTDALTEASVKNLEMSDQFKTPENAEEESRIKRMQREDKKSMIDSHIKALDTSARDTVTAYADIESQSMRIKTMKDANDEQQAQARVMSSQGISGVADRLSVVLQAVSAAAIGESSAVSKARLSDMNDRTNAIASKEVIRLAMGGDEVNRGIIKAMDELSTYGEIYRAATDITRQSVSEMRQNLDKLRESAEQVSKDVKDSISVNAEVARGEIKAATPVPVKEGSTFNF